VKGWGAGGTKKVGKCALDSPTVFSHSLYLGEMLMVMRLSVAGTYNVVGHVQCGRSSIGSSGLAAMVYVQICSSVLVCGANLRFLFGFYANFSAKLRLRCAIFLRSGKKNAPSP